MNTSLDHRVFQAKAVLCIVLALNVQFWLGGCGISGCGFDAAPFGSLPAGTFRIELTPEHPLSVALRNTAFADARAVEIDPATRQFRVIFPDEVRQMSGKYVYEKGAPTVTEFRVAAGLASATMELDASKHVTRITTGDSGAAEPAARTSTAPEPASVPTPSTPTVSLASNPTSDDHVWVTPAEWLQAPISSVGANGYERANAQLLAFAREMDDKASTKTSQASFAPVLLVFGVLAAIWAIGAILSTLTIIFAVLTALQALLASSKQPAKVQVARILDADTLLAAIVSTDTGESLGVLAEKDVDGNPIRVTGATFRAPDGSAVTAFLGSDGLPAQLVTSDASVVEFLSYGRDTADIRLIGSTGASQEYAGIPFDADILAKLRQFAAEGACGTATKPSAARDLHAPERERDWLSLGTVLEIGGLAISGASCGLALTAAPTVIGVVAAVAACGSFAVSAYEFVTGDEVIPRGADAGMDLMGCVIDPVGNGALDCLALGVDLAEVVVDASDALWNRRSLLSSPALLVGTSSDEITAGKSHTYRFDKTASDTWVISVTTLANDLTLDARVMKLIAANQTQDVLIPATRAGETTTLVVGPTLSGTLFLKVSNPHGSPVAYKMTTLRIRAQGTSLLHGRYRLSSIDGQSVEQMFPSGPRLADWVFSDGQLVSLVASISDTGGERQLWQHLATTAQTRWTVRKEADFCNVIGGAHSSGTSLTESRDVSLAYVVENLYRGGCDSLEFVRQTVDFSGQLIGTDRLTGQCRISTTFRMLGGDEQSTGDLTADFVFVKP